MINRSLLRRNLLTWLISLFVLLFLIIIVGIIFQGKGINPNNFLLPICLLIFPSYFFVFAYYGIRYNITFSKNIIGTIVALIVIITGFSVFKTILVGIFWVVGGFLYTMILRIKIDSQEDENKFAGKVGIISFILGLIILLFIFYLLIRTYIVFG